MAVSLLLLVAVTSLWGIGDSAGGQGWPFRGTSLPRRAGVAPAAPQGLGSLLGSPDRASEAARIRTSSSSPGSAVKAASVQQGTHAGSVIVSSVARDGVLDIGQHPGVGTMAALAQAERPSEQGGEAQGQTEAQAQPVPAPEGGLAESAAPAVDGGADRRPLLPLGIAHRGASAELPEHTREAYEAAVAEGADFVECDVVLTSDLLPLCRHEPNLLDSTDAAAKFPDRLRSYVIDGERLSGVFSFDLTAAEVASLRAVQPWPIRNQAYNGRFRVATLADYLEVARSANRAVGIYPETKHPSWTNALPAVLAANTSLEAILLDALEAAGWDLAAPLGSDAWRARPLFLQSFEAGSLRAMAGRTRAPMVLLLGEWEGWTAPDSNLTLAQLTTDASLAEIASWAAAVGPAKDTLVAWQPGPEPEGPEAEEPDARESGAGGRSGGGSGNGGVGGSAGRYVSSGLVERFHAHGLQVHTYTLRPEHRFFLPHLADHYSPRRHHHGPHRASNADASVGAHDTSANGDASASVETVVSVVLEYELLGRGVVGVDAMFTDHMPSFREWRAGSAGAGAAPRAAGAAAGAAAAGA